VVDDRKKRLASHRDFARPQSAVPTEIDPEATPPPREPPSAEAFSAMPIAAKVDALHHVVQEQGAALERVWDARHVVDRLERLETIVEQDTRQVTTLIAKVEHFGDLARKSFDKSNTVSDKQIERDAELKVFFTQQFPEYLDEVKTSNALLRSVQERMTDVENRVEIVEAKQTQHDLALANLDKVVDGLVLAERDKQVASTAVVTERRRWFQVFKLGHAIAIVIGGGVAWFVHWLKS